MLEGTLTNSRAREPAQAGETRMSHMQKENTGGVTLGTDTAISCRLSAIGYRSDLEKALICLPKSLYLVTRSAVDSE